MKETRKLFSLELFFLERKIIILKIPPDFVG